MQTPSRREPGRIRISSHGELDVLHRLSRIRGDVGPTDRCKVAVGPDDNPYTVGTNDQRGIRRSHRFETSAAVGGTRVGHAVTWTTGLVLDRIESLDLHVTDDRGLATSSSATHW